MESFPYRRSGASHSLALLVALIAVLLACDDAHPPAAPDDETLRNQLQALGYATWSSMGQDKDLSGVVTHDKNRSQPGFNIYTSVYEAYLVDMEGNRLHTWFEKGPRAERWIHVEPYPNGYPDGDLLVVVKDTCLMKLRWNSEVEWVVELRAHHDVHIAADGDIYVLFRREEVIRDRGMPVPLLNDYIAVLSPEGQLRGEISIFDALKDRVPTAHLARIAEWASTWGALEKLAARQPGQPFVLHKDTPVDIFHTNSIEVIGRDIEGLAKKGDFLISIREVNLVAILDPQTGLPRWSWGPGEIQRQHQPTLLDNDRILLFDNGTRDRAYSRIIELDPLSSTIVWDYLSDPPEDFFSEWGGGNQHLPNGNILVTDTVRGRVFEMDRKGEVVWDFFNPSILPQQGKRETIYRCHRLTDTLQYPFLKRFVSD
jgi:hypothetical protein